MKTKRVAQTIRGNKGLLEKARNRISHIDNVASRHLFGDDNSLTRNLLTYAANTNIKIKSGYRPVEGPRQFDAKKLHKDGYVTLKNTYDDTLVKTVQERVKKSFETPEAYTVNSSGYNYKLLHPQENVPEIKDLITPGIINALYDYYGCYFSIENVYVARNLHVEPEKLAGKKSFFSNNWHTDRRMPNQLKMFYLVNDTDETQGPFHIINKDTTQDIIKNDFQGRKQEGDRASDPAIHYKLTGDAGSALIGNTARCLHKAGVPEKGKYRDLIYFVFFPSDKPLQDDWYKDPACFEQSLGKKGRWWI